MKIEIGKEVSISPSSFNLTTEADISNRFGAMTRFFIKKTIFFLLFTLAILAFTGNPVGRIPDMTIRRR